MKTEGNATNCIECCKTYGLMKPQLRRLYLWIVLIVFIFIIYDKSSSTCLYSCETNPGKGKSPRSVPFPTRLNGISGDESAGTKIDDEESVSSTCLHNLHKFNDGHFKHPDFAVAKSTKDLKTILVMVGNYGTKNIGFGFGSEPFEAACCKEFRCFLTDNRTILPMDQFDAIVFHYRTMLPSDLPQKKSMHQKYIMFDLEPSSYVYQDPEIFNGIFNLTWNFREDADITYRYGRVLPKSLLRENPAPDFPPKKIHGEGKSKLVAWFVSRCSSLSWREHFVENLQNYIQVDVYGHCGTMTCSTNYFNQCYMMAEDKYKFYLSFENSLCKDYATEKFFNILKYDLLPIVYGGADYAPLVPRHSYIDALDFKDTEALANYLHYLDKNDTAYNEYFKWKENYFLPTFWGNIALNFCDLCAKLHEKTSSTKVYGNLTDYFVSKAECTRVSPVLWWERLLTS